MNFIKKWIREEIKKILAEFDNVEKQVEHFTLSPDHPNVITVPVGKMNSKDIEDYLKTLTSNFKKSYPKYKFIFIPKSK